VTIEPSSEHPEVHVHAGGQGAWIANMLAVLDVRTLLCAPLGGEIGAVLSQVLQQEMLEMRCVTTQTNGCYVEDRRSGELECLADMPATSLDRHQSDDLCNQLITAGLEAGVVVLTGPAGKATVAPDVYRRVSADLASLDVTVVADLSGPQLEAALEGGVSVLKISHEEIGGDDPVREVEKLREGVRDAVVLTRAAEPALLFTDSTVRAIHVPRLETVDHRGAGDSMTAGIAAALARGSTLDDAMRLGAAAGAVNVTRHGLASGRRDTIDELAKQVQIKKATKQEVRRARADHQ
jgi:1-phosphofructokinase